MKAFILRAAFVALSLGFALPANAAIVTYEYFPKPMKNTGIFEIVVGVDDDASCELSAENGYPCGGYIPGTELHVLPRIAFDMALAPFTLNGKRFDMILDDNYGWLRVFDGDELIFED